jgi:hypothetical protein
MKLSTVTQAVSPFVCENALATLRREVELNCSDATPLRLAVTDVKPDRWQCEIDCVQSEQGETLPKLPSIFDLRRRRLARTNAFNAVFLVPTGIDCAIGGHAGDATPAARLIAAVCDHVVLHPNVVNASDINEQPENCSYVEGSLICRLLMGTVALRKVRSNRILVVTEEREDGPWTVDQVVNTASAARATLGVDVTKVVVLRRRLSMSMGRSQSGRAVGYVGDFGELLAMLRTERASYDAVALSTKVTPDIDATELFRSYYDGQGPNPWGGVEALLTHTVSSVFDVPSAHAPTIEDLGLRTFSYGRVEPRKSAEAISTSYTFCVLKGLHRAPAVVTQPDGIYDPALLSAEDISCVVTPAGCVGLPTLAALLQGITVIAVRENTNIMNGLAELRFAPGQLLVVDNYLEAAGMVTALKAGIHPMSVRRPLAGTPVTHW